MAAGLLALLTPCAGCQLTFGDETPAAAGLQGSNALPADTCAAATIEVGTIPFVDTRTTIGMTDDYDLSAAGTCAGGGSQYAFTGIGPDIVYRIVVDQDCNLNASMDSVSADMNVSVLTDCSNLASSCLWVDDGAGAGGVEDAPFTAVAGVEYFILVDGYGGSSDAFTLTLTETTSTGCSIPDVCTGANNGAFCHDGNACTDNDVCSGGVCTGTPLTGTDCDDGNACTDADTCTAGVCAGTPDDTNGCDDGNPCTDDACSAGACVGTPDDTNSCSDNDACTDDVCSAGACDATPNAARSCVPCSMIPHDYGSLPWTDSYSTSGGGDTYNLSNDGTCAGGGTQYPSTGLGADAVYRVKVDLACDLTVNVDPTDVSSDADDMNLYVVTDCDALAATCIEVDDRYGAGGSSEIIITAIPDVDYFLIVDGYGNGEGPFDITITEATNVGCRLVRDVVSCDGTNDGLPCDDGTDCTDDDTCTAGACVGTPNADPCNDGNACTENDVCAGGICGGTPNDTLSCDDGNACTGNDGCVGGVCAGTPNDALPCDDGNPCTDDACASGSCLGTPDDANTCSDNIPCTTDACVAGACTGTPIDCSHLDQSTCLRGFCNRITGFCEVGAGNEGGTCNDDNPCTENDTCDAGTCVGSLIDCSTLDDGICQVGGCNPATGLCEPRTKACSAADQPCNPAVCNNTTGICEPQPGNDGAGCDDSDPCTENDTCSSGHCAGTEKDCNDACSTATCDAATGDCINRTSANEGGDCDDGQPCTEPDTCLSGVCTGTPASGMACDDGNPCTDDVCQTGSCVGVANDTNACSDGLLCTTDSCGGGVCASVQQDCSQLDSDCIVGTCNRGNGSCVPMPTNDGGRCDDSDACTKQDTCAGGVCAGVAKDCSLFDGLCTIGVCDPGTGICGAEARADGTACDDGDRCTADSCIGGVCVGSGSCAGVPGDSAAGDPGPSQTAKSAGCACDDRGLTPSMPWLALVLVQRLRRRRTAR